MTVPATVSVSLGFGTVGVSASTAREIPVESASWSTLLAGAVALARPASVIARTPAAAATATVRLILTRAPPGVLELPPSGVVRRRRQVWH